MSFSKTLAPVLPNAAATRATHSEMDAMAYHDALDQFNIMSEPHREVARKEIARSSIVQTRRFIFHDQGEQDVLLEWLYSFILHRLQGSNPHVNLHFYQQHLQAQSIQATMRVMEATDVQQPEPAQHPEASQIPRSSPPQHLNQHVQVQQPMYSPSAEQQQRQHQQEALPQLPHPAQQVQTQQPLPPSPVLQRQGQHQEEARPHSARHAPAQQLPYSQPAQQEQPPRRQREHCQQCLSSAHLASACTFSGQRDNELQARALLSNGNLLELAHNKNHICNYHRDAVNEMLCQDPAREGGPLPPRIPFSFKLFDHKVLDETALFPMCDGCEADSGLWKGMEVDTCVCATKIVSHSCMLCEVGRITAAKMLAVMKRTPEMGPRSLTCGCGKPASTTREVARKCVGCSGIVTGPYKNVKGIVMSFAAGTVETQGRKPTPMDGADDPAVNALQEGNTDSAEHDTGRLSGSSPADKVNSNVSAQEGRNSNPDAWMQDFDFQAFHNDTSIQNHEQSPHVTQPAIELPTKSPIQRFRNKNTMCAAFSAEDAGAFADMGFGVGAHANPLGQAVSVETKIQYWVDDHMNKTIDVPALGHGLALCGWDMHTAWKLAEEVGQAALLKDMPFPVVLQTLRDMGVVESGKRKTREEDSDDVQMVCDGLLRQDLPSRYDSGLVTNTPQYLAAGPSTKRPRLEGSLSQQNHGDFDENTIDPALLNTDGTTSNPNAPIDRWEEILRGIEADAGITSSSSATPMQALGADGKLSADESPSSISETPESDLPLTPIGPQAPEEAVLALKTAAVVNQVADDGANDFAALVSFDWSAHARDFMMNDLGIDVTCPGHP